MTTPATATSPNPKHPPHEKTVVEKVKSQPTKPQPSPNKPLVTSPMTTPATLADSPSPVAPTGAKIGPKRLQFITLSSPKANKKKQVFVAQDNEPSSGLLFDDAK